MVWFVLFQPQDFRCGVTWKDGVPFFFQEIFCTTKSSVEFFTLGDGGCVAPEFGRANDAIICVERNEAVLLSADPDGADFVFSRAEFGDDFLNRFVGGGDPFSGVLFEMALGEALNEGVGLGGGREDFA